MSLEPTTDKLARKQKYYPWLILVGCCCMQIGGIGVFLDSCGVFYTPAAQALGISVGEYSHFLSFSFIGTIPAAILTGRLMGRVDIRYLIGVNVLITACILMFMGYYPSMEIRNIGGFLFGFSGGFYFMVMTPILVNNWFVKRKGLALGIAEASSGVGAAILSPLITLLIQAVGWQLAYVCTGLFVIVLILPWVFFVFRLKPEEKGLKPYGWTPENKDANATKGARASGVPEKYSVRTISFICLCIFVGCIAVFSTFNSYLNSFAQTLGYSAIVSSTLLTAVSVGSIFEKMVNGFLYDYIGIYKITWINCGLLALGLILLGTQTDIILLYIGAALFGVQNSLVAVQTPLLVRALFGDRDYARLVPYTRVGIGLFGMMGPYIASTVSGATGSFAFVWLAGLGFVALAICFVLIARFNKFRYMNHWLDTGVPDKDETRTTVSASEGTGL
jgi:MFS family permease